MLSLSLREIRSRFIVGHIERLVLSRREEMRIRNTIDSPLDDGNKVFFTLFRGYTGDRKDRWTAGGGDEVFLKRGR